MNRPMAWIITKLFIMNQKPKVNNSRTLLKDIAKRRNATRTIINNRRVTYGQKERNML